MITRHIPFPSACRLMRWAGFTVALALPVLALLLAGGPAISPQA